jgi:hypothetical protein
MHWKSVNTKFPTSFWAVQIVVMANLPSTLLKLGAFPLPRPFLCLFRPQHIFTQTQAFCLPVCGALGISGRFSRFLTTPSNLASQFSGLSLRIGGITSTARSLVAACTPPRQKLPKRPILQWPRTTHN